MRDRSNLRRPKCRPLVGWLCPRQAGRLCPNLRFRGKLPQGRKYLFRWKTNVDLRPTLVFPKKFATPLAEVFGPGKTNTGSTPVADFSLSPDAAFSETAPRSTKKTLGFGTGNGVPRRPRHPVGLWLSLASSCSALGQLRSLPALHPTHARAGAVGTQMGGR